ncbi:hypothetical protein QBC43DRAFT_339467 [Cladorrhinum sp. PSN259]|nr:hypothetical protein QBC43DRAFT_339467 [Cladorrhinum sp. PSN259]
MSPTKSQGNHRCSCPICCIDPDPPTAAVETPSEPYYLLKDLENDPRKENRELSKIPLSVVRAQQQLAKRRRRLEPQGLYPHRFYNAEGLKGGIFQVERLKGNLLEFPIIHPEDLRKRGLRAWEDNKGIKPGPVRVVYSEEDKTAFAVIYHNSKVQRRDDKGSHPFSKAEIKFLGV